MSLELKEFAEIVDAAEARRRRDATSEDDLHQALQALFMHQCVYSDWPLSGRPYTIVLRHRDFVEKYAAAMNYGLAIDRRDGMAALYPKSLPYGWKETRLKKDETLVLLALRYVFEDSTRRGEMSASGRIETNTDAIYDAVKTLAQTDPPAPARLLDILKAARRRGLVRYGDLDRDEQIRPVTILPGIRILISDTFVEAVIAWIEQGAVDAEETFFDRLADHRAGEDPEATAPEANEEEVAEEGDPEAPDDLDPDPDQGG